MEIKVEAMKEQEKREKHTERFLEKLASKEWQTNMNLQKIIREQRKRH